MAEQEQIINKFSSLGQTTLRGVFQALAALTNEGVRAVAYKVSEHMNHQLGEQQLYTLLSTSDAKDVRSLPAIFNEPVNLNVMREYLTKKGVPFSFDQQKDHTDLYFKQCDSKIVEKALAEMTEDVYSTTAAQEFTKKPEQTAAEYVKQKQATSKGKGADLSKSVGKARVR